MTTLPQHAAIDRTEAHEQEHERQFATGPCARLYDAIQEIQGHLATLLSAAPKGDDSAARRALLGVTADCFDLSRSLHLVVSHGYPKQGQILLQMLHERVALAVHLAHNSALAKRLAGDAEDGLSGELPRHTLVLWGYFEPLVEDALHAHDPGPVREADALRAGVAGLRPFIASRPLAIQRATLAPVTSPEQTSQPAIRAIRAQRVAALHWTLLFFLQVVLAARTGDTSLWNPCAVGFVGEATAILQQAAAVADPS